MSSLLNNAHFQPHKIGPIPWGRKGNKRHLPRPNACFDQGCGQLQHKCNSPLQFVNDGPIVRDRERRHARVREEKSISSLCLSHSRAILSVRMWAWAEYERTLTIAHVLQHHFTFTNYLQIVGSWCRQSCNGVVGEWRSNCSGGLGPWPFGTDLQLSKYTTRTMHCLHCFSFSLFITLLCIFSLSRALF